MKLEVIKPNGNKIGILEAIEEKHIDAVFFCPSYGLMSLDACFSHCSQYVQCMRVSEVESVLDEWKEKRKSNGANR